MIDTSNLNDDGYNAYMRRLKSGQPNDQAFAAVITDPKYRADTPGGIYRYSMAVTTALLAGYNPWAPADRQPCQVGSAEYERRYPTQNDRHPVSGFETDTPGGISNQEGPTT